MRKRICLIWQGVTQRKDVWNDGLRGAMRIIEKEHDVTYHEPQDEFPADAIILYWEAPVTILGRDSENYKRIQKLPNKKFLLFAGGRIQKEWLDGFDHVFVESKINSDELEAMGISHSTAFGINEEVFRPIPSEKKWWGGHFGTCASWKRQWLVGEALGKDGLIIGRYQENDRMPFDTCKKLGCTVIDEMIPADLVTYMNQCHVGLQTSEFWGGGQRMTLEFMACNIPVVCMNDSPKNMEYVEESGCGLVTNPNKEDIFRATVLAMSTDYGTRGRDYIMSKWTMRHYADNLLKEINK